MRTRGGADEGIPGEREFSVPDRGRADETGRRAGGRRRAQLRRGGSRPADAVPHRRPRGRRDRGGGAPGGADLRAADRARPAGERRRRCRRRRDAQLALPDPGTARPPPGLGPPSPSTWPATGAGSSCSGCSSTTSTGSCRCCGARRTTRRSPPRSRAGTRADLEDAIAAAGACAAVVRTRQEWTAHEQGRAVAALPLLSITRTGDSDPEPLGPRSGRWPGCGSSTSPGCWPAPPAPGPWPSTARTCCGWARARCRTTRR